MHLIANRLQIRLLKNTRDFAFVDKIGTLTNAFINFLPNTELQRNGQYGALIVTNTLYNFQAQITQLEINLTVNFDKEIDTPDFKEKYDSLLDLIEKIITIIRKNMGLPTDIKSMICLIEFSLNEYDNIIYNEKLKSALHNSFLDIESDEVKQINYTWNEGLKESYVNVGREGDNKKVIYAIQDFERSDASVSRIKLLIDDCFRDFRTKILLKIV